MSVLLVAVYGALAVAVGAAVVLSLFVRRHGESDAPAQDWRPTDEAFLDPTTRRRMRVWLDPGGARHYVPDGDRGARRP